MLDFATNPTLPHSRRRITASAAYWTLQFAGWTLYFWSQASGEVIFADVPWSKSATLWGGFCISGLALTHLLRLIIRRERWLALPPRALLVRLLIALTLLASALFLINVVLSLMEFGAPVAPILGVFYRRLSPDGQLFSQFINRGCHLT